MRFEDLSAKANVRYHTELNPVAWNDSELKLEVRVKLLTIAKLFVKYLEIPNFKVEDIVLTGSMVNFNWTKYSDFDLHVITDYSALQCDDIAEAFYRAKKQIWNDAHDITIGGHEVEMYVEDSATPPVSQGVYSVLSGQWLSKPVYKQPSINDQAVTQKATVLAQIIDRAVSSDPDPKELEKIAEKIKHMRRAGLDQGGEFSVENLAFKVLRNQGYIDKLHDAKNQAMDKALSLSEAKAAKITRRQSQSSRGISTYGDAERANSDYVAYRLGQAMAMSNGKDPIDMDAKSWYGKRKTIHPYTEVENEMFKQAAKVVGADYQDINKGDMRSLELDTVNKTSPVSKPKRNKYGV